MTSFSSASIGDLREEKNVDPVMLVSVISPDECHYPRLVVLPLSVLQTEVGDLDPGDELHLGHGAHLVQLGQDLAGVGGEGHQDGQVGEGHEGHIVLGV